MVFLILVLILACKEISPKLGNTMCKGSFFTVAKVGFIIRKLSKNFLKT